MPAFWEGLYPVVLSFTKPEHDKVGVRILLMARCTKMYTIQHYVIKFVSDLQQIGGFLWVLRFPPPI